jgi:hypothetical protein
MTKRKLVDAIKSGNLIFSKLTELDKTNEGQVPNDPAARKEFEELHRKWWANSAETLKVYVQQELANKPLELAITPLEIAIKPPEAFPNDLLMRLSKISESLGNGHIHPVILNARKPGAFVLEEREAIAIALYYLEAVACGEIGDTAPIKTVYEAFKVKRQTVQKWQKERASRLNGLLFRRPHTSALHSHVIDAGKAYQKWGYYGTEKKKKP